MRQTILATLLAAGGLVCAQAAPVAHPPTDLSQDLAALKADFNAAKGMPRFLTVVSPTCPACRHGVEAIREAILERPESPAFRLFVVWAPMLSADDEPALKKMAERYGDARTRNYLDPNRRAGTALRRHLFPDARADMLRALPANHYFREYAKAQAADKPEWDIYLAFDARAQWNDKPPEPSAWIRQTARFQTEEGGELLSLMWIGDYAKLPVEGDLVEAIRRMADAALKVETSTR